jgi:hypothetical protein
VPETLADYFRRQPWVRDVVVRVRERGREFTAEAHIVPATEEGLVDEITAAAAKAREIDPRLAEITISPLRAIPAEIAKAAESAEP